MSKGTRKAPSIALLIALATVSPLAMNIVIPALPTMAEDLGTSYGTVQSVITLYLVALAVSQLFLGPLSDRFGRRPVMIGGFVAFVIGSLICATAGSAPMLILGRILQAGGCVGLVLGRAILRDLYDRDRSASLIGYVTMAMVVAPMLAPAIGGYVIEVFDWRYLFWALLALGAGLIPIQLRYLYETATPRRGRGPSGAAADLLRESLELVRLRAFLGYALVMAFGSGMFFSFMVGAPYLVIEVMGRPPGEYGLYFALASLGYMFGNFLSGRFAVRFGPDAMIFAGVLLGVVGMALLWLLSGLFTPVALFAPMGVIAISNGLSMPSSMASAISVRPDLAGTAFRHRRRLPARDRRLARRDRRQAASRHRLAPDHHHDRLLPGILPRAPGRAPELRAL